jgi:outer membrane biosynthesis protein TonB
LATGPDPVDRPMPPEPQRPPEPQPRPAERTAARDPAVAPPAPPAARQREPGFRGNQQKTALRGSISRRGPSSLDVENNALGRYQAALSRAVEREWQRNCVRYRDFITPGFLTVRFLVEPDGRIRGLQFIEVVEASEIQKGFTLNSIRGAPIPPMPAELKRNLDGDPLELIYNFYF